MPPSRYNADIVAGGLLLHESRIIAGLLLQGLDARTIQQQVRERNALQKRSPASAKRQARLIVNRLHRFDPALWRLVHEGTFEQTTQALLVAAIEQHKIVGDFVYTVVGEKHRTFQKTVSNTDWSAYFEQCAQRDASITAWRESTRTKIKTVVFRILAEAKIIDSARRKHLLPFFLLPEIRDYLHTHPLPYVNQCLEIFA